MHSHTIINEIWWQYKMWACEWVSSVMFWKIGQTILFIDAFFLNRHAGTVVKIAQQQHQQKQHTGSFNWDTMDLNDCNLQLSNRMEANGAYKLQLNITCINLNSLIRAGCSTHWMDPCQENPFVYAFAYAYVRVCMRVDMIWKITFHNSTWQNYTESIILIVIIIIHA